MNNDLSQPHLHKYIADEATGIESSLSGLVWLDTPTEAGWYWMKYWLSSKPAVIKQIHYFAPHFVIDTSPLKDWDNWKFSGPLLEP